MTVTMAGRPFAPGAPLTPLVGRERERLALADALRRHRLVTVTGPGGVGKTRIAQELVRGAGDRPCLLVDLAPVAGPTAVAAEVARAAGVTAVPGADPAASLVAALGDRPLLLVLDNCEHVADAVAGLLAVVLPGCAGLRVLATSRGPLGIAGEAVHPLAPLSPPDALRLFGERARLRDPGFLVTPRDEPVIARLCARLDHLPLAIELAAARVAALTPAEILLRLETGLPVLGEGERHSAGRPRTLRATVDWSVQLLDDDQRRMLRALSVFVGTFDADAALAVAASDDVGVLASLVDRSLVQVAHRGEGGPTRYRLLETVRARAAELLTEAGELGAVRRRHLAHLERLSAQAVDDWLGAGDQRAVNALDADFENVRAALERAVGDDPCAGVRLLAGARDLFFRFGQADGLRLARLLLERCPEPDRYRGAVLVAVAQLEIMGGEPDGGARELREAEALAHALGERGLRAWASFFAGLAGVFAGRHDEAAERFAVSRRLHRESGNTMGEVRSLVGACSLRAIAGDAPGARAIGDEGLALAAGIGDRWGQGAVHTWLGVVAADRGEDARATRHLRAAAELLAPSRDTTMLPMALAAQAVVLSRSDPARAARVAAAAGAIRDRVGGRLAPHVRARLDAVHPRLAAALGAALADAEREGAALAAPDAVALAFGTAPAARAAAPGGLTLREREVADLVAAGLANSAIAGRMHLSVRTVETHVRNALHKTGALNRTQLATWVREGRGEVAGLSGGSAITPIRASGGSP